MLWSLVHVVKELIDVILSAPYCAVVMDIYIFFYVLMDIPIAIAHDNIVIRFLMNITHQESIFTKIGSAWINLTVTAYLT